MNYDNFLQFIMFDKSMATKMEIQWIPPYWDIFYLGQPFNCDNFGQEIQNRIQKTTVFFIFTWKSRLFGAK